MKKFRIYLCCLFAAMIMFTCLPASVMAQETTSATILFTHDLHSHFLPARNEGGGEYGGYGRLMTVINQQKQQYPDAVLLDGGDFSMGSLFQTAYATSALELRVMGAMGYDATTFGNHEYDYLPAGFASMLNTAADSGDMVPAIVEANYLPPVAGAENYTDDSAAVWSAFENYGVEDYILLERGGVYYAIIGIMGVDSDACAPNSGQILHDPVKTTQETVDAARAACHSQYGTEPLVVVLSHSGTEDGQGEDYELAKAVKGVHLIISGHTHTTLQEPIRVEDTWIVSAGEYGRYLGVVQMDYATDGKAELTEYQLIPVDETVEEEPRIGALVESYKAAVEQDYLAKYNMSFDQVLTNNTYEFDTVNEVYATHHESTLCNVFSDAYRWAAESTLGHTVDMALTASGVIRETIPMGAVTVSDVFNAASLGVGTEGELVAVYLTGSDLKNALEVDASIQPLMRSAQLFCSGVEYSFNTYRMIFNKVDYAMLRRNDGTLEAIEDDRLYCVVTGMYMAQMLGSVEETSMGLISITPRDIQGNPVDRSRLADYVIRDDKGVPVKEWYAIASYLQNMGDQMDSRYAQPDGRKVIYSSWNPINLLSNANRFTYFVLAALLAVIAVVWAVVQLVRKKAFRRKRNT